jgi:hypothetical protein
MTQTLGYLATFLNINRKKKVLKKRTKISTTKVTFYFEATRIRRLTIGVNLRNAV